MDALDLYKFIKENEIELRWDSDELSCWIPGVHLDEFCRLAPASFFDDGGVQVVLTRDGSIWIDLVLLCEYCGVDPERIKKKPIK